MSAYSMDLRERVVQAALGGMSRAEVVATFRVSLATLKRWLVRDQQGDLRPKPIPGRTPHITPEAQPRLCAQLQEHPDATLEEHRRLWHQHTGHSLSRATMARAIARAGYTRKKRA